MTLDEAIKHCEEKAKELRKDAKLYEGHWGWEREEADCLECAREHEQLAGWLRELKAFRKAHHLISQLPVHMSSITSYEIMNDCLKEVCKE